MGWLEIYIFGAFALGRFLFITKLRNEEITTRKMVNFQYVKRFGCFFCGKVEDIQKSGLQKKTNLKRMNKQIIVENM